MKFTIDKLKVDLGLTPVENIFINNYMAMASGDQLKVYLYGYKSAYEHNQDMDMEALARELDMTPEQVEAAWDFWESLGIVKTGINYEGDKEYQFLSLRQLYLNPHDEGEGFATEASGGGDILEEKRAQTESLQDMFIQIQEVLEADLMPNEIIKITEAKNEYRMDPEVIAYAFKYSAQETGKKNLNYVLGIIRNWKFDGIHTMADLEKNLAEKKEREERPRRIKRNYHRKSAKAVETDARYTDEEFDRLVQEKLKRDMNKIMGEDE